jgi:hypothetical protein
MSIGNPRSVSDCIRWFNGMGAGKKTHVVALGTGTLETRNLNPKQLCGFAKAYP